MPKYQRLNIIEREEISRELATGASLRQVARVVNRSPSTISREVKQCVANRRYYRAYFAQCRSNIKLRKIHSSRKLDRNYTLRNIVFTFLAKKWSPEQIAKQLAILYPDDMNMRISHESIYSYLYVLPRGELKKRGYLVS